MTLITSILKNILLIITIFSFTYVSANAETLTNMVNQILDSHEDIVNAKKELEEADRDITDALLAYAPDLSVKYETGKNEKEASDSNSVKDFKTWDWTWKQKIMDSGATLNGIRNKQLESEKSALDFITARNDLLIEAADAYLGLIKAGEKLEASVAAEENTRATSGQEEIRVQVGSGLASDVLKAKRQLASAQKTENFKGWVKIDNIWGSIN